MYTYARHTHNIRISRTTHVARITRKNMSKRKRMRSAGGFSVVTSCLSTAMVLVMLGLVAFSLCTAENIRRSTLEEFTVQVLLDDSLTPRQTHDLQLFMSRQKPVRQVVYTSKEQATKMQAEVMGEDAGEFLGGSPYPASFELFLHADYANKDSLDRYLPAIQKHPGITEVIFPEDLIDLVNRNIRSFAIGLLCIAALLGLVSFSLINNTMRFSAYAKRHDIDTMKLIGAKWSFIRRPFIWEAFWIGLVAALLASTVLVAAGMALLKWDEAISVLFTPTTLIVTFSAIFLAAVAITTLCAFFSVNRFLRLRGNKVNII